MVGSLPIKIMENKTKISIKISSPTSRVSFNISGEIKNLLEWLKSKDIEPPNLIQQSLFEYSQKALSFITDSECLSLTKILTARKNYTCMRCSSTILNKSAYIQATWHKYILRKRHYGHGRLCYDCLKPKGGPTCHV